MSYEKVSTDTGTDYAVEDEPFLSETQSRRYQQPRRWPWILGTVLSSTLSCVLLLQTLYLRGKDTTCPAWRESDFRETFLFFCSRAFLLNKESLASPSTDKTKH